MLGADWQQTAAGALAGSAREATTSDVSVVRSEVGSVTAVMRAAITAVAKAAAIARTAMMTGSAAATMAGSAAATTREATTKEGLQEREEGEGCRSREREAQTQT